MLLGATEHNQRQSTASNSCDFHLWDSRKVVDVSDGGITFVVVSRIVVLRKWCECRGDCVRQPLHRLARLRQCTLKMLAGWCGSHSDPTTKSNLLAVIPIRQVFRFAVII